MDSISDDNETDEQQSDQPSPDVTYDFQRVFDITVGRVRMTDEDSDDEVFQWKAETSEGYVGRGDHYTDAVLSALEAKMDAGGGA